MSFRKSLRLSDRQCRSRIMLLLLCVAAGSVLGFFAANMFLHRFGNVYDLAGVFSSVEKVRLLRFSILAVFFPVLIFAAGLCNQKRYLFFLFVLKGFAVAYLIRLCEAGASFSAARDFSLALLLSCILPLPACFFSAAVFLSPLPEDRPSIVYLPLILLHLSVLALTILLRFLIF